MTHDSGGGRVRRALYMCAAHCQGGHSDAGAEAADTLGIPFPVTMQNLVRAALKEGLDPDKLWPWMDPTLIAVERKRFARKEPPHVTD